LATENFLKFKKFLAGVKIFDNDQQMINIKNIHNCCKFMTNDYLGVKMMRKNMGGSGVIWACVMGWIFPYTSYSTFLRVIAHRFE